MIQSDPIKQREKKRKDGWKRISCYLMGMINPEVFHPLNLMVTVLRYHDEKNYINKSTDSTIIASALKSKMNFIAILDGFAKHVDLLEQRLAAIADLNHHCIDVIIRAVLIRARGDLHKVREIVTPYINTYDIRVQPFFDYAQLTMNDAAQVGVQWSKTMLNDTRIHSMKNKNSISMMAFLQNHFDDFQQNEGQTVYNNYRNSDGSHRGGYGGGRGGRGRGGYGNKGGRGGGKGGGRSKPKSDGKGKQYKARLTAVLESKGLEQDRSLCFWWGCSGECDFGQQCKKKHECNICHKAPPTLQCPKIEKK